MTLTRIISIATVLVPVILFLGLIAGRYYYRYLDKRYRFLVLYLFICFCTDVLSRIAGELYNNNLIFIIIFSLLELLFFFWYYRECFYKRRIPVFTVVTLISAVYIIYEMYALKDVSPKDFQPYSKVICSFIIIILSINFLFEKMANQQTDQSIIKLNSTFVLYFSLNLIFFLPVNFLINVTSSVKFYFWCANLLLTVSFYTFLSMEIWKNGSTRKQLHSGL